MLRSVYWKTLRDQRKALVWWAVGLVALVGLYVAVYPTVRDRPELNRLIEEYPEVIKALIGGAAGIDFTSPAGYLNNELFSFVGPLVFLVFAIGLGASAIAGEEDRGTIDLLLATPLSRDRLVLEKAAALATLVGVLGLVLWLSLVILTPLVQMEIGVAKLGAAVASIVLLVVHFGSFSLLLGAATGRRGLSIGLAASAALVAYVVNALGLLVGWLEPYRKFSPYYHYLGEEPLRQGLAADHVGVLLGASIGMVVISVVGFRRRDVRV